MSKRKSEEFTAEQSNWERTSTQPVSEINNAALQGNKAITVPSGAGLITPSSGSLPNTSGPAGAAPLSTKDIK